MVCKRSQEYSSPSGIRAQWDGKPSVSVEAELVGRAIPAALRLIKKTTFPYFLIFTLKKKNIREDTFYMPEDYTHIYNVYMSVVTTGKVLTSFSPEQTSRLQGSKCRIYIV